MRQRLQIELSFKRFEMIGIDHSKHVKTDLSM